MEWDNFTLVWAKPEDDGGLECCGLEAEVLAEGAGADLGAEARRL